MVMSTPLHIKCRTLPTGIKAPSAPLCAKTWYFASRYCCSPCTESSSKASAAVLFWFFHLCLFLHRKQSMLFGPFSIYIQLLLNSLPPPSMLPVWVLLHLPYRNVIHTLSYLLPHLISMVCMGDGEM